MKNLKEQALKVILSRKEVTCKRKCAVLQGLVLQFRGEVNFLKNLHKRELANLEYESKRRQGSRVVQHVLRLKDSLPEVNQKYLITMMEEMSLTFIIPKVGDTFDPRVHEALGGDKETVKAVVRFGVGVLLPELRCLQPALVELD